jgi:hypothetical protein
MPTRKVVLIALTTLLVGLLVGGSLNSRPVYDVRAGNAGCIGIKSVNFDHTTATYFLEIANVYGSRPCLPEDSR